MALTDDRRLLLVHAHPDDESINNGATMARYAAEGVRVTLVTCTRGELGEVIPPELAHLAADRDGTLGAHRAGELAAAMAALGVTDHRFLDTVPGAGPRRYHDSGMAWGPDGRAVPDPGMRPGDADVAPFALVDVEHAAARLAAVLREVRPHVVVGYDPGGGYGHPDHVQAHLVTTRAVELAREAGAGGPPWPVPKAYWTLPSDDGATACVDAPAHLPAKTAALRAHATQVTVDGDTFALSNDVSRPLTAREAYRLVRGAAGGPRDTAGRETDLFG